MVPVCGELGALTKDAAEHAGVPLLVVVVSQGALQTRLNRLAGAGSLGRADLTLGVQVSELVEVGLHGCSRFRGLRLAGVDAVPGGQGGVIEACEYRVGDEPFERFGEHVGSSAGLPGFVRAQSGRSNSRMTSHT
jgi:hypothetical protein